MLKILMQNCFKLVLGEDECFDLNNITSSEIRQFPNLKEATIMSSNFDKVKEIFVAENIDVELL